MLFLDTEEAHTGILAYPVMPIFSRPYLSAAGDVVTEMRFRGPDAHFQGFNGVNPTSGNYRKTRWNSL